LLLADASIRDLLDLKIFVETDDDVRFTRRLQRDVTHRGRDINSIIEQYEKTVKPMHLKYVQPSRKYADIVLSGDGSNAGVEVVVGRVKRVLR